MITAAKKKIPPVSRDLVLLSKARAALAEAKDIREVKSIRDQGQAAIRWAKSRRDIGTEAINEATEIVLRAERRLGEMLKETVDRGRPKKGNTLLPLSDHGITKMQSSRWQAAAAVPEKKFEEYLFEVRQTEETPTSAAVVKMGRQATNRKTWAKPGTVHEGVCSTLQELIDAGKKFRCIYADPPWQYGNQSTRAACTGLDAKNAKHYDTMTVEEICAEPVADVTAPDAHLHLWTTNSFLPHAFRVIEAWGFEYRSCFVWVKRQMGIGNYWRVSHEFMLLGIRGEATNFLANDETSWLEADRTKHSRKPYEVRRKIERVSPGPYLEMYGREMVPGWTVYGNQIAIKDLLQ